MTCIDVAISTLDQFSRSQRCTEVIAALVGGMEHLLASWDEMDAFSNPTVAHLRWDVRSLVWDYEDALANRDGPRAMRVGHRMYWYLKELLGHSDTDDGNVEASLDAVQARAEKSLGVLRGNVEALKYGIQKFVPRREWSIYVHDGQNDQDSNAPLRVFRPITLHSDPPLHIPSTVSAPPSHNDGHALVQALREFSSLLPNDSALSRVGVPLIDSVCRALSAGGRATDADAEVKLSDLGRALDEARARVSSLESQLSQVSAAFRVEAEAAQHHSSDLVRPLQGLLPDASTLRSPADVVHSVVGLTAGLDRECDALRRVRAQLEEQLTLCNDTNARLEASLEMSRRDLASYHPPLQTQEGYAELVEASAMLGDAGAELRGAMSRGDVVTIVALCIEALQGGGDREDAIGECEGVIESLRQRLREEAAVSADLRLALSRADQLAGERLQTIEEMDARMESAYGEKGAALERLQREHAAALKFAEERYMEAARSVHPELDRERKLTRELTETIRVLEKECRFCHRSRSA